MKRLLAIMAIALAMTPIAKADEIKIAELNLLN